jgi:chloramphenicol-sensitive protein RarD
MQLLCGVVLLGEQMSAQRWVGFGIVWLALIVLTVDSLVGVRRRRLHDAADDGVCEPAP